MSVSFYPARVWIKPLRLILRYELRREFASVDERNDYLSIRIFCPFFLLIFYSHSSIFII